MTGRLLCAEAALVMYLLWFNRFDRVEGMKALWLVRSLGSELYFHSLSPSQGY